MSTENNSFPTPEQELLKDDPPPAAVIPSLSASLIRRVGIISGLCFILAFLALLSSYYFSLAMAFFYTFIYLGLGVAAFGLFKLAPLSRPGDRSIKTIQVIFWLAFGLAALLLLRMITATIERVPITPTLFFIPIMVAITILQVMMVMARPLPRLNGLPLASFLFLAPTLFIRALEYSLIANIISLAFFGGCWLIIAGQLARHGPPHEKIKIATSPQPAGSNGTFFRQWLIISTIGWILLLPLQFFTPSFHGRSTTGTGSIFVLVGLLLIGLGMAASQWYVLRSHLAHAIAWIPATLAGVMIGFALSRLTMPQQGFFVNPDEYWDNFAIVGYDLLFVFPFVAVMQAVVLWFTGRWRALFWIPVKGVALSLSPYAAPIGWLAGYLGWPGESIFLPAMFLTCLFPLAGVLFALATGWYLQWLLGLRTAIPTTTADTGDPEAVIV